jgi:hypothetical protein
MSLGRQSTERSSWLTAVAWCHGGWYLAWLAVESEAAFAQADPLPVADDEMIE